MKSYKGIIEFKDGEMFIKNINTNRYIKVPHYCKGAIYPNKGSAFSGSFHYNDHLKDWTFVSWQDTYHEINDGDLIEIFK